MTETIAVPKALLQILFDTAVNSMDFGSGFLDDEEVVALRQAADLLGVDPMEATPSKYRQRFAHRFVPTRSPYKSDRLGCEVCTLREEADVHRAVAP